MLRYFSPLDALEIALPRLDADVVDEDESEVCKEVGLSDDDDSVEQAAKCQSVIGAL